MMIAALQTTTTTASSSDVQKSIIHSEHHVLLRKPGCVISSVCLRPCLGVYLYNILERWLAAPNRVSRKHQKRIILLQRNEIQRPFYLWRIIIIFVCTKVKYTYVFFQILILLIIESHSAASKNNIECPFYRSIPALDCQWWYSIDLAVNVVLYTLQFQSHSTAARTR